MCGIAGILALGGGAGPDPGALAAMVGALAHRGPDGAGTWARGPVALGARRLALVDPAGGGQPLVSEDGDVVAVCNGEIYNWRALREELHRRGHAFATGSDCEVLVHLYEEHGARLVEHLRGMWALALWDARRGRLLLARDPFGIKPLVLARPGGDLAFASELKALLAGGMLGREIDPGALAELLAGNAIGAPRTIFAGAQKLEPGCVLVADAASGEVAVERRARPRPAPAAEVRREPLRELAGELRERLAGSVAAHLAADVPVGLLLSGGLDSGMLCALAGGEAGAGLPTFSVGFAGAASFDELATARRVARRFRTDHHEVVVGPADAAAHLRDVARTFDEPRGDATALPYWLAARAAGAHVKAVLSGEGADELLAGYQTYAADLLPPAAVRAAARSGPALARIPSSSRRLSLDFRLRRLALGAGLAPLERHQAWKEILPAEVRAAVLAAPAGDHDVLSAHRRRWAQTAGAPLLARLQDVDVGTFLADDLLPQADRAGMAHAVEVRVPYLDREVAALALALPTRAKVRGLRTKVVLREAARPLLPRAVALGPKRGFVAPTAAWLRGPLEPLARELLSEERLRAQGLLRPAPVRALLDRHVARREDLSRPLWMLMALTLWHERWSAGAPASVAPAAPIASCGP